MDDSTKMYKVCLNNPRKIIIIIRDVSLLYLTDDRSSFTPSIPIHLGCRG